MRESIIIYRADNKGNITMPEKFCTDGLLTKQINGGNPLFMEDYGWLNSIKSHIHFENNIGQHIYNTSAFLSFTAKREIAENIYLQTKNQYKCEKTTFEFADAYLFSFEFDRQNLISVGEGIYLFQFRCNYEKFKNPTSIHHKFIKCSICVNNAQYIHNIILIDVYSYLIKFSITNPTLKKALENAIRDKEWLILPLDLMNDGMGFHSRIPVADFWNVEFYKFLKS
jgi:hypothetical protein